MPILWRYLLRSYFQVFGLCVLSFISILLIFRFQEIAQFAASGTPKPLLFLFILYQIPYILPIAIPIACLIAAILLFQKLSFSCELTALRAAGLGLKTLVSPMIMTGLFLGLLNFTFSSEISTRCKGLSKQMVYQATAVNPLFLLQKDTLVKFKNAYIDMKALRAGKYAEDVLVIMKNRDRLGVMLAKEFALEGELLTGSQVTFITHIDPKKDEGFDHVVVENQATMSTKASNLAQFIQDNQWMLATDYMPLRMVLAKKALEKSSSRFSLSGADEEIARRLSLGFAAFTFTLMGTAFGMQIGRHRSKKGVFYALFLSLLFMVSFVTAKSFRHNPTIVLTLYLLPHALILFFSLFSLKRLSEGKE